MPKRPPTRRRHRPSSSPRLPWPPSWPRYRPGASPPRLACVGTRGIGGALAHLGRVLGLLGLALRLLFGILARAFGQVGVAHAHFLFALEVIGLDLDRAQADQRGA